METIFDFLNCILYTKQKKSLNCENSNTYSPFMINRWCSFYSNNINNIINLTTNKFTNFTKEEHFKFLKNFLPKVPFRKISYVKKKVQDDEQNPNLEMLAKNLEISKREINHYILCQKYL